MAYDPLILLCKAHRLPEPEREVAFAKPRRFKCDWLFWGAMLMVEQEGGIFSHGRHVRGAGYLRDMEKYNIAALEGFRILRFTPQQIQTGDCLPVLRCALERFWSHRPWPNELT